MIINRYRGLLPHVFLNFTLVFTLLTYISVSQAELSPCAVRLPMSSYLVRDPGSGAMYGTLPHQHHHYGGQEDLTRQRSLANIGMGGYGGNIFGLCDEIFS